MFNRWIASGLIACAAFALPHAAHAEYPDRPIRLIVPFSAGGSSDVLGRLVAEAIRPILGQPIIVENKPGAGGNIGGDLVAKAKPDGYTLLLAAAGPTVINPHLYNNMTFDPAKDLAPITVIAREHNLMAVHPSVPAETLSGFIEYAKKNPGTLSFGSPGNGSPAQLAGELLKQQAGIQMQHVPYKGSAPAVSDLVAGHIHVMIDNMPALLPQVGAGRLRALAVPSDARAQAMPDTPTFGESGVQDYVIMAWKSLMAPAGTPAGVIDKVQAAVAQALQDPELRRRLTDLGAEPWGSTPAEFRKKIEVETTWWGDLIERTGTRIE